MDKLDINSQPNPTPPVVDDPALLGDNRPALSTTPTQGTTNMAKSKTKPLTVILLLAAVVAGSLTGFGGYKLTAKSSGSSELPADEQPLQQVAGEVIKEGDVFGSPNAESFPDPAEGYLEKGGLEGDGTHHILRPGGPSQTVYLTSSVTDLDKFIGMEVKIWGETFGVQKAGWFMDAGRVQVLKTEATPPTEE